MSSETLRAPPTPSGRLRAHLSLARISNTPTVASNVLAGAALGGATDLGQATLLLMLAMVLFYTAGMYLNDLFDYELDRRERPERPLPSGVVSRREATAVTVVLFAAGLALLALISLKVLLGGVVLAALIVAYDRWHKGNPLSPLLMASTRMLVYLISALAFRSALFGAAPTGQTWLWTVLLGLYIVGLTYIAKTERRTDLARYWPAALLVLPAVVFVAELGGVGPDRAALTGGLLLLLAFLWWVSHSLTFLYRPHRRDVGRTVGHLIAGVSLLDALVLVVQGASALPVLLALAAFALTLLWQRFIKGT